MAILPKELYLFCIALFTGSLLVAQKPLKLFTELGLKGNVKAVAERTYEALENFGKPEKGDRAASNADYEFLKNGDIAEQNIYNQNGSLRTRHVYIYNEAGKLAEQNLYNPGGPLRIRFRYKYNNSGHLYEQRSFKPDGSMVSKYVFEYDKKGNQTVYSIYNSKGQLTEKTVYAYDSANNQTG